METNKNIKEQIWPILFLAIPFVLLTSLSKTFAHDSLSEMLYAGLLGGLGALIGSGIFQLVKTKTALAKTVSAILLTGVCIIAIIVITKLNKPSLETCEVCGYKAVKATEKKCEYCGNLIWDEQKKVVGYDDKLKWLKEEQLLWFWIGMDSATQKIDFYNPIVSEGFTKDIDWKPVITNKELLDYYSK